jgi:hypothetical protein
MKQYHTLDDLEKAFIIEMLANVKFNNLSLNSKNKPYISRGVKDLKFVRSDIILKCLRGYKKFLYSQEKQNDEVINIIDNILQKVDNAIIDIDL